MQGWSVSNRHCRKEMKETSKQRDNALLFQRHHYCLDSRQPLRASGSNDTNVPLVKRRNMLPLSLSLLLLLTVVVAPAHKASEAVRVSLDTIEYTWRNTPRRVAVVVVIIIIIVVGRLVVRASTSSISSHRVCHGHLTYNYVSNFTSTSTSRIDTAITFCFHRSSFSLTHCCCCCFFL